MPDRREPPTKKSLSPRLGKLHYNCDEDSLDWEAGTKMTDTNEINVRCSHCGREFTAPRDATAVSCPECGKVVALNLAQSAAAPTLKVRRGEPIGPGNPCPSCGQNIPPGAVLCTNCGFDLRTGRPVGGLPFWKQRQVALVAAAVIVILLGLWLRSFLSRPVIVEKPKAAPPPAAPPPPAPELPAPTPAPEPSAETPPPEPSPPPPEEPSAEALQQEWERLEAEYRAAAKARLDAEKPLYKVGTMIEVRKQTGQILRGMLRGITNEQVILLSELGEQRVPLRELDRDSVLRCDPHLRERFIEMAVRKKMESHKELQPLNKTP